MSLTSEPEESYVPDDAELALEREIESVLSRTPELKELEAQLFGHVLDCIDFDRLHMFEQLLWGLVDELDVGKLDEEGRLSGAMMSRAIVRAANDPARYCNDVPPGVTQEEARAARFDPECPFCRYEDEQVANTRDDDDDDCECDLCDELARAWRAEHAGALRRRGVG